MTFFHPITQSAAVAQSAKAPNSNHKNASLMHTLDITHCCILEKTLNAIIPFSDIAAQWARTQVGNRKIINFLIVI